MFFETPSMLAKNFTGTFIKSLPFTISLLNNHVSQRTKEGIVFIHKEKYAKCQLQQGQDDL